MSVQLFIVDTNIVVSGLLARSPGSPTVKLLDGMLNGDVLFLLSADLLAEYRSVLRRPKIVKAHAMTAQEIDVLLTELTANSIWRTPKVGGSPSAPEPGDQHLWDLWHTESSAVLITGDQLLLQNPRSECHAVSAADCVSLYF